MRSGTVAIANVPNPTFQIHNGEWKLGRLHPQAGTPARSLQGSARAILRRRLPAGGNAMKLSHRHFLLMSFLACGPALAEPACNLPGSFAHATRSDGTRTVRTGQGALLFTAPLAVNTDGAPNSYHPDDPWGRRLALNNICNGANAVLADGRKLDYRSCPKLIAAFEQSRRSGWHSPKIQFYAVATENGRPCTIRTGKYVGYFVSTTSLAADSRKPACDPGHWLDSNSVPFAIYPGHRNFTSRGVGTGDLVVIRNPANGRISY